MRINLPQPLSSVAGGRDERRHRAGIVAGVVAFLVVLTGGVLVAMTRPPQWTAADSAVVLPRPTDSPETMAGYYDTLSRGQMVATFAELVRQQRFQDAVAREMGLSPGQAGRFHVAVEVVPNTAMISTAVTGPSSSRAEAMAEGVAGRASAFFDSLRSPYTAIRVSPARGTAERTGASRASLLAVTLVAGLAVGFAAQQAVQQITAASARRRSAERTPVIPARDRPVRRWRA